MRPPGEQSRSRPACAFPHSRQSGIKTRDVECVFQPNRDHVRHSRSDLFHRLTVCRLNVVWLPIDDLTASLFRTRRILDPVEPVEGLDPEFSMDVE